MEDSENLYRPDTLEELEPSPVEDTPLELRDDYFPSSTDDLKSTNNGAPSVKSEPSSSTFLGLNRSLPWYLLKAQRYSSYAFTVFATMHITNTSIIPLVTRSVPDSESYLLLTRPYYQSPLIEPLIVIAPLVIHVGSGLGLRLYRRRQDLSMYGAEATRDRRKIAWPKVSGTSKLGYLFLPFLAWHAYINRIHPLIKHGGSSSINLSYVSTAFAKAPAVSFFGFAAMITIGAAHFVWGAARYLNLAPSQVTKYGVEGQQARRKRLWLTNAVTGLLAGIWMAGGIGVVGRGGSTTGWLGREYEALYKSLPLVGSWL